MYKFLHLTDLHVKSYSSKEYVYLNEVVKHIVKTFTPATHPLIVISGDFVHNGTETEYRNVTHILKKLKTNGFKILACPGNHDFGQGGSKLHMGEYQPKSRELYFEKIHRRFLGEDITPEAWSNGNTIFPKKDVFTDGSTNYLFIGLDTMHGSVLSGKKTLATGKIDDQQYNTLEEILSSTEYAEHTKIVYMHHHLYSDLISMVLHERDHIRKLFQDHSITLVCFGHLHRFGMWNNDGNIKLAVSGDKTTDAIESQGQKSLIYQEFVLDKKDVTLNSIQVKITG